MRQSVTNYKFLHERLTVLKIVFQKDLGSRVQADLGYEVTGGGERREGHRVGEGLRVLNYCSEGWCKGMEPFPCREPQGGLDGGEIGAC